jgi:hypothetical protein
MSFYTDASLVLIPSGYKTSKVYSAKPVDGSGDLTFSRSNDTATRVASNGLIERVRTNLLSYSNDFSNAYWIKSDASVTSGQGGYDGTTNAWKLTPNASNVGHYTYANIVTTGLLTFSVYAKPDGYNFILLYAGGYGGTFFDISTGTIGGNLGSAPSATKIEAAGNGFYRCSITVPSSADVAIFAANTISSYVFTGNGTSGVLIQSAQYETGDIATDYIATTSAAVSVGPVANLPRLDYSGGATCPKLLLEPQRTNLYNYSEQLDQWLTSSATVTANYAVSPDGYTNADRVQFAAGGLVYVSGTGSAGENTLSVYAKATNGVSAKFSFFANGAVTFSSDQTATGEWQRFTFTYTYSAVTAGLSVATTGADDVIFYGFQHEIGDYETSYIPTLGSASTRGSDACSKTGISSLIGQTEGTIFWEGKVGFNNSEVYVFLQNTLGDSIVDSIFIQRASGVGVVFNIYDSSTQVVSISGGTYSIGQNLKIAAAYKLNDVVLYVNGVQIGTDTSAAIPATTSMQLGAYPALPTTELYMSDNVKQTLLFKTRLSNSDLATLTA